MSNLKSRAPSVLLVLILALALALRLTGVGWDSNSRLHPDERFLTGIVSAIGKPENLTSQARDACPDEQFYYDYFNTECSVYNPDNVNVGSFAYGTLPLYIVRGAAQVVERINPGGLENPEAWSSYDYIHYVARVVDALADALVVLLVFLIGRKLLTPWHGLLAAALYACAVLPIQLAHFWAVDSLSNLFFMVGLYASAVVVKGGRSGAYLLFGVALGCAVASRINIVPMAALLPLAVLVRQQHERRLMQWRGWIVVEAIRVLGSFALAVLVFRIAQPYAFLGPTLSEWRINEAWWRNIEEVSNLSRLPSDGWPPSVQWFERIRYVYPWFNMMMWGMGLVAGISATVALVGALLVQAAKRKLIPHLALLSLWVVGYFAVTGNVHQMTMRYYLPLYAPLFLLAAWLVIALAVRAKTPFWRWVLPVLVVGATAIAGISFTTSLYTQPITRVEASAWVNSTLPTTIDLSDADGRRVPVNVEKTAEDLALLTAFKGESYISDSFDLYDDQQVRLEVQFTDPRETQLRIELLDANDENNPALLKAWEMVTDAEGRAALNPADLPRIASGRYQWHITAEWSEFVRTEFRGMTPPVVLRYYLPVMIFNEDGFERRAPVRFRNPYQDVPYVFVGGEQNVNLLSEQAITVSELTFAHIFAGDAPLTLTLGEAQYTATPAEPAADENAAEWNNILGDRQRYVLDRPMEVPADTPFSLTSGAPLLFTATALANDGDWDDAMPTSFCTYETTLVGGIGLTRDCEDNNSYARFHFVEVKLNMAETDSEVKYRRMVDVLTKADYFIISSNRFYDAQPRVLRRFAMSSEFYDRLFIGDLRYTLLNTFRRGSNFLGVEFPHDVLPTDNVPAWWNELEAEEAFTVYDHPTVFVFRNDGFQRYMLPEYVPPEEPGMAVAEASALEPAALGAATYELATRPQSDDDVVFALLVWTVGFLALGWVTYPLMYALFPALPLRGFAVGRGLAWLLLSLVPWWLTAMLGRFFWTRPALWLLVFAFVGLNLLIAYRHRVALREYVRTHWRSILTTEVIFLLAFAVGLVLRAVNPDLWQIARGGEKPMDFAYLNAVLLAPTFPPPNPWMAGLPINYYYFGFVIIGLPIKIGGIASEVGYNLGLATLYAVMFSLVFTLGYALLPQGRRWLKTALALVGAVFALVAGNLGTLKLILAPEPGMEPNSHRWYWYPTRILGESANGAGGAINEFPAFSFLFGDLHAHIIGLLPTMLFLTGFWALYKQRRWYIALLIGVIAGTIYMTNIWDVLLYAPVALLILLLIARKWTNFVWWGILMGAGALIAALPYLPNLSLGSTPGVDLWNHERSLLEPFVLVWGIPIVIATLWLVRRAGAAFPLASRSGVQVSAVLIVVVALLALPPVLATTVLCAVLALAALALAWRDAPAMRLAHLGIGLVFGILLALEYIVVKGDVGRMNTVFKISFQLWMWVGVLIPLILYWMLKQRWFASAAVIVVMIGFGGLFLFYAAPARGVESMSGNSLTLEGNRFFAALDEISGFPSGAVLEDLEMIRYLRGHSADFPVIAEWYETEYNWNGRFSVQTGLPAIVGWGNHMRQQYGDQFSPQVDFRIDDMRAIYLSNDVNRIREVIREYDVRYILVGSMERVRMDAGTWDRLNELIDSGDLTRAFTSGDSVIYEVVTTPE